MNHEQTFPRLASLILIISLSSFALNASIYCPPNKTVYCYDDIHNLQQMGRPTAIGYPASFVKYIDNTSQTNSCGVGVVSRKWYVDVNQNNAHDNGEGSCAQTITVLSDSQPISIQWPDNKTFTCIEEITYEKPIVSGGPCDVLGIAVDSMVFNVAPDACYKIMRRWKVVNWCTYHPTDPNWNGEGYYEQTQLISVIEKTPPTLADCSNKIIGLGNNCKTPFTIENSAMDALSCQSQSLRWTVEIDLWADGTKDYVYGYLQSGIFYLASTANDQKVTITLPIEVGAGKHKVYWSVGDLCGNIKTCQQIIETKDLKAPTPYMTPLLTSAFDGRVMDLMVTPKLFDRGSTDNCTPQKRLKCSFSPNVNDTLRIVDCNNSGFQFYTIYVTDEAGNQDYVEVFMLAFDNGSCFGGNITGNISQSNGKPISNASITLSRPAAGDIMAYSNADGVFEWDNISVYNDYKIEAINDFPILDTRDIADIKKLQEIIMGRYTPVNYEWVAADVNADGKINIADLYLLKSMVISPTKFEEFEGNWHSFILTDTIKSMSDVKALESSIDIMELKSYPSFKAVFRGDITNANNLQDNESNGFSEFIDGKMAEINLASDDITGMMIKFSTNALKENIAIKDMNGEQIPGELYFDAVQNQYVWLSISNKSYGQKLEISSTFEDHLITVNEIQSVDVHGRVSKKMAGKSLQNSSLNLHPNPSSDGCFNYNDIQSEVLAITDFTGRNVPFSKDGNKICINSTISGMYFIQLSENSKTKTHKLTIVR